jgi:high-affinity Fe2+/Pb2+ permease
LAALTGLLLAALAGFLLSAAARLLLLLARLLLTSAALLILLAALVLILVHDFSYRAPKSNRSSELKFPERLSRRRSDKLQYVF